MCDHCGCREVTPIRRLMDEHERLLDLAGEIRDALRAGDPAAARARFAELTALLLPHVRAEERGLFSVMRERGEFTEHVDALEAEHGELEARIAAAPDDAALPEVLDRLQAHIYAENFGLFPAALAGLGGDEWAEVEAREGRTAAEPLEHARRLEVRAAEDRRRTVAGRADRVLELRECARVVLAPLLHTAEPVARDRFGSVERER